MTYNNEQFLRDAIKMLVAHYLENMAECEITPEQARDDAEITADNTVEAIKLLENHYQKSE